MKPLMNLLALTAILVTIAGCKKSKVENNPVPEATNTAVIEQVPTAQIDSTPPATDTIPAKIDSTGFVPKGYVLFETIDGDLNKDGVDDRVMIVKATDKSGIVPKNEGESEMVDRNRRGFIILFKKNGKYELALQNLSCCSSENEDGGVYYAPELSVEIANGCLRIFFYHGRYGNWGYTFRYQNSAFELIGYDRTECAGPVINSSVSINFSTGKQIDKVNTNENSEGGDEVFEETVSKISKKPMLKLSQIKDFDELSIE